MVHDDELRELFRAESQEYLQSLESGLLALECAPATEENLERLFRNAHSLKGAARIMGFKDVETLAHEMEDRLRDAHRRGLVLSTEDVSSLLKTLDTLNARVAARIDSSVPDPPILEEDKASAGACEESGYASNVSSEAIHDGSEKSSATAPHPPGQDRVPVSPQSNTALGETITPDAARDHEALQSETIRVRTRDLDRLMTQSGELQVVRTHLSQKLQMLRQLLRRDGSEREGIGPLVPERLSALVRDLSEDLGKLDSVSLRLAEDVSALRMLPLANLFDVFPRMVRDLAADAGKRIDFVIEGGDIRVDRQLIESLKSPVTHLLRNAIDHGLESERLRSQAGKSASGKLVLRGARSGSRVLVEVSDDGSGLDLTRIKEAAIEQGVLSDHEATNSTDDELKALVFRSGLTTKRSPSEISGRGVGLDVVRQSVDDLDGQLLIESQPGQGSIFSLELPLTLATAQVMLAVERGHFYGFAVTHVECVQTVDRGSVFRLDGAETIMVNDEPVSLVQLSTLLELEPRAEASPILNCVVLRSGDLRLAVAVEHIEDQIDVAIRPLGALIRRMPNFSGCTILPTGDICLVLHCEELINTAKCGAESGSVQIPIDVSRIDKREDAKRILLVEDSLITRVQERRILEGAGYQVSMAVDGEDALRQYVPGQFAAVVTDINMPNMNGFELTGKIRRVDSDIPVVIVTTMADPSDRQRGLEVGASAYITKGDFKQSSLLETLERLVGTDDHAALDNPR